MSALRDARLAHADPPAALELAPRDVAVVPPGTSLLVVESGAVALVTVPGRGRRRMVLAVGRPGAVMLAPREPEEALVALRRSVLRVVDDPARDQLLASPLAAAALVESLADALRDREESLSQFGWLLNRERVRAKLVQLARRYGRVTRQGIRIELPLTHQLLAETIGAARETVTVALRELREEGVIARSGRIYTLQIPPEELDS